MKMGQSVTSSFYNLNVSWLFDYTNSFLLGVVIFVALMMMILFFNKGFIKISNVFFLKGEFFYSAIPILILLVQMLPSFFILFSYGLLAGESLIIKINGQQWFWSYEYGGYGDWLKFDSYLESLAEMKLGELRLLSTDERLVVPVGVSLLFSIYSYDVIHSWALPGASLKIDAMPGVFSNYFFSFNIVGVLYGMCSEFCGVGHSFMPIVVEVVPEYIFFSWSEDRKHLFDIATRLGDWYKEHGTASFF